MIWADPHSLIPQLLKFSLEILNAHNDLRTLHEVGPVKLSEKVLRQNSIELLLLMLLF